MGCLVFRCERGICGPALAVVPRDAWAQADLPRQAEGNPTTGGYSREGFTVPRGLRALIPSGWIFGLLPSPVRWYHHHYR